MPMGEKRWRIDGSLKALIVSARSFGLEMGEANRLSTLGLLGLILREEPTLRQALQTLLHYRRLHNESLVLRLQEDAGHALLHLE